MYKPDEEKTTFITPRANYCYVVMPFGLKNAGVTYQRLMNKVFAPHIGNLMEVYMDNMLVKTKEEIDLLTDLSQVFNTGLDLLGPFSQAPGQVKYLIVGVNYFTKWIEAEPLATITTQRSRKFLYKNIITRYAVPHSITTDNGTQFTDSTFKSLVASMKIKHQFTSVEHPQANGQAEAANKVKLSGLKKRLQDAKGAWTEELPQVLWAYRTTLQSATAETPFRLAYGIEAMIPVEINEQSPRVSFYDEAGNIRGHKEELELLPEVREQAQIRGEALKQRMANRYNKKVIRRSFTPNDLVLIKNDIGVNKSGEGKLAANWKGLTIEFSIAMGFLEYPNIGKVIDLLLGSVGEGLH
ncbi:uncharacterized protein LOC130976443 [Arachis stenosperma]|uniref:uncharacterized protein LOC130976443 n=1 Tax=Arachis stenosperma TaxID=217475 RepID=UPI0025ABEFDA|nr:uncharacterized protein LOC130976443 [Arachis stenosperma]